MATGNSDPSVRRARPGEAVRLSDIAFRSKAYWGYSPKFMAACRDELALSSDDVEATPTYVAVSQGEIVGFYTLARLSAAEVELGHLFVEPAAIGKGFGRRLIEHAKRRARAAGYATLVIQGDPNAERFYRAAGGRVVGETPSASIPGRLLPLLHIEL